MVPLFGKLMGSHGARLNSDLSVKIGIFDFFFSLSNSVHLSSMLAAHCEDLSWTSFYPDSAGASKSERRDTETDTGVRPWIPHSMVLQTNVK